jgi:hypothetical protein
MRYEKLKISALILLIFGITGIHAQESIPASGGNAVGSGGSVTYTVGQLVYTTNTGVNGSVAHGVQQAFEISTISWVEQGVGINLICTVYPNPTTDFLTLKVEDIKTENLIYRLYSISGRLLESKKIESSETSIAMINFNPATYFLKVSDGIKEVKTFKIIKTQ